MPPPTHIVTIPYRARRRCISKRIEVVNFAPVQPSGCPRASAPPFTLRRVVSMPSADVFARQDADYQATVLPKGLPRVALDALFESLARMPAERSARGRALVDPARVQVGGLSLDHREVQRAVRVERGVGGGAEPVELEGGHREGGQRRNEASGRMQRTTPTDSKAIAAKAPKMILSGI